MEELLATCHRIFDKSTQPFGVAHVKTDDRGTPTGFSYEYLNPAMAKLSDMTVDHLVGKDAYEFWPNDDTTWLDYFARAAYHGIASEFDAASLALSEFLHVSVFPIERGYCGFFIQGVTQWVSQAHTSLKKIQAGIFFYDLRRRFIMLTPPARDITGFETEYISFVEFTSRLFGEENNAGVRHQMDSFRAGSANSLLATGQLPDGRWLRISLGHMGDTDHFAFGLIEDITRLHEAEQKSADRTRLLRRQKRALQTALDLAEQSSKAKSAFLANVSHDFRTPMNAITGFADIALECLDDRDCVEDCLNKILMSSAHLLDLVNEILDVCQIESGKMTITCLPMQLGSFLDTTSTLFAGEAERKGIAFSLDASGIIHDQVVADKTRLSQVLVNVLGNAVKFTPMGGQVTCTVTERKGAPKGYGLFVFRVQDTGCGMSKAFLARIFEPFERANTSSTLRVEGTGLGMTITKSLVELMGGTITVESEEGVGSVFTISIPLELEGVSGEEQASGGVDGGADDPQVLPPTHRKDATPEVYDFSGRHALIADDDELSREVLKRALGRYGFAVDEAEDGEGAVENVRSKGINHYDVVMLDMRMPRMNGIEAARRIRSLDHPHAHDVPILAVTADVFDETLRDVEEAGMSGRITKPLDIHQLMSTLKDCLS